MNSAMRYIRSFSLLFFLSSLSFVGSLSLNGMGKQQQMSPSQMQDIEKELLEANRAIEEYVASLPPAEQEEFNRAVEEVSQMFENMSEEEFSKFLGEMFTEEPMPMPMELETPQTVEPQEVIEQTVLSGEQKRKAETVIAVLDDIIKKTDLFLVQTQSSPEILNAITRWGTKGTIANWQSGSDWKALKNDIEKLVQQLYKAEDQDLVTKQYKYLFDVIADESLLNNLIQLQTNLNNSIPRIELSEFGIEKLSSKTKKIIKNVLSYYTESLYLLAIPKSLDTIFEKYEPTAKKSREAEEAAEKKALEASKRTRTPASATEAGYSSEGGYGGYGGYGDYGYSPSYGGGYSDYGYSPSYGGDYGGYSPGYGNDYDSESGMGGQGGQGGGGQGGGAAPAGEVQEETEEEKAKKAKLSTEFKKDEDVEDRIKDIKTTVKNINKLLKSNPLLVKIDEQIVLDTLSVDDIAPLQKDVVKLNSDVKDLIDGIAGLQKKVIKLDKNAQEHYKKSLQSFIKDNKKALVDFETVIKGITYEQKLGRVLFEPNKNKIISPRFQWAFFGDKTRLDQEPEAETKLATSIKLSDVQTNIKTLFDAVNKFPEAAVVAENEEPAVVKEKPKRKPDNTRSIEFKEDEDVEEDISTLKQDIKTLNSGIKDYSAFTEFNKWITRDDLQLDDVAQVRNDMEVLKNDIETFIDDLAQLQKKVIKLDKNTQEHYKTSVQDKVKENSNVIAVFEKAIKGIEYELRTGKMYSESKNKLLSPDLQWAFFGDDKHIKQNSTDAHVLELQSKIPTPLKLSDVQATIKKFFDAVDKFPTAVIKEKEAS